MAALPALVLPLEDHTASIREVKQLLEVPGIFRGHEFTRKDRRLNSGISQLDALIGGIARGRISEITGTVSSGKTTIAAAFAAATSRRGEVVGWVDVPGAFDPRSLETAGANLARILWLSFPKKTAPMIRPASFFDTRNPDFEDDNFAMRNASRPRLANDRGLSNGRGSKRELKAAELLLEAGGFGLVIIDFGAMRYPIVQSSALRLARAAEKTGTAVLALASNRICGTFAALTLSMAKLRASFSRDGNGAPALFDGLRIEASVARNKLGVFGDRATLFAATDPLSSSTPSSLPISLSSRERVARAG
jgi:hypothetical protein